MLPIVSFWDHETPIPRSTCRLHTAPAPDRQRVGRRRSQHNSGKRRPWKKTDFVRFEEEESAAKLQTATITYTNDDGVSVDLIGAIHIADKSYYDKLNKRFRELRFAALRNGRIEARGPLEKGDLEEGGSNPIRSIQVMMQKTLELDYQLSAIDYTAKNFVHADMDYETFRKMQKERNEGMLQMMLQSYKAQLKMMAEGQGSRFDEHC